MKWKWEEMVIPVCMCYLGFSKIEKKQGNAQGNWKRIDRMTFLFLVTFLSILYMELMIYHLFWLYVLFFLVRDMLFVEIVGWLYNRNWGVQ